MGPYESVMDGEAIDRMLENMVQEILAAHEDIRRLNLIGIKTRGVFLANRIQSLIKEKKNIEVPTGEIDITMYRDDWTRISSHPVVEATDILFSIDGKKIILVDDVLFTGRTTRAAMDAVIDFGRPDRIESAVLIDRGHRELPIKANYIGKVLETERTDTVNVLVNEYDGEDRVVIQKEAEG
jgi:pyrimidine operon attenuation protein/uracil phosphoribosyltransferase